MLTFNEEDHKYLWKGKETVSVTQMFSRVGVKNGEYWSSISGTEHIKGEYAAEFGKAFHELAELRLKGEAVSVNKEAQAYLNGLNKFLIDYKSWDAKLIEKPLYSEKYKYAGTLDVLFELSKNMLIIVDWKTSVCFFEYWRMQLAAYAQLIKEHYKLKYWPKTMTVRIVPNGYKPDARKPTEVAMDFNRFLSILNTYKMGMKQTI